MNGHHLRHKLILWNKEHIEQIEKVLDALKNLQDTKDGAFFKNSRKNEQSVFSTIECLFPFLLYPFSQNYSQVIDDGIQYIVSNTTPNGVPLDSQFPANTPLVDSTAFGIYVFTMANNYYLEERKKKFLPLIEDRIRDWIKFIFDNKNSCGWGLLTGQKSRVYSTSLVVGALSNCEDYFFDSPQRKDELLNHGIQYLGNEQDKNGGWGCENGSGTKIINPQITATAIFALNSSLRFNFDKSVEQTINKGAEYLLTAGQNQLTPFKENISIQIGRSNTATSFEHPYYMVLPALLMTGHMGFHANGILNLYNKISQSFKDFQPNKGYNYYELSEIANALILFFSTANVARKSDLIFSSAGLCPACSKVERSAFTNFTKWILKKIWIGIIKRIAPLKKQYWKFIFISSWVLLNLDFHSYMYLGNEKYFEGISSFLGILQIAGTIGALGAPIFFIWRKYKKWGNNE